MTPSKSNSNVGSPHPLGVGGCHWVVFGADGEDIDGAEIGIWTAGKKVIEYDGVFELPKEAVQLLNEYGLDTKEVTE